MCVCVCASRDRPNKAGWLQGLALYGRGDHVADEGAAHFGRVAMTVRGSYLLLIFLPFLLLGPLLLVLAQALQPRAGATAPGQPASAVTLWTVQYHA